MQCVYKNSTACMFQYHFFRQRRTRRFILHIIKMIIQDISKRGMPNSFLLEEE